MPLDKALSGYYLSLLDSNKQQIEMGRNAKRSLENLDTVNSQASLDLSYV